MTANGSFAEVRSQTVGETKRQPGVVSTQHFLAFERNLTVMHMHNVTQSGVWLKNKD